MKSTVIVPTYRRQDDLTRCLHALQEQIQPPFEVIVVVRDEDNDTWALLETLKALPLPLKTVTVTVPGVIAAMNAGLEMAAGDVIVFTDDDSAPHPNWLSQIEAYFLKDKQVGGVGGRDIFQYPQPWDLGKREIVGKLEWYGKMIGEHHRGVGAAREVDILKGVNMSFRRTAIANLRFDERLRGTGAQVHFEVAFCLTLRRQGWKLIYDPAILVDHYTAQRFDEDQRHQFNAVAFSNAVHNETLALLEHLTWQRSIFLIWCVLIGTCQSPGFVQWLRWLPTEQTLATQKWLASMQGRWQGWQSWRQSQSKPANLRSITTQG